MVVLKNSLFKYLFAFGSLIISTNRGISQTVFDNFDQLNAVRKFYNNYATLYARDLFSSVYPAQSLSTFNGSQIMAPSAFSIDFRAGYLLRFPPTVAQTVYSSLEKYPNIKVSGRGDGKLRFKQPNVLGEGVERLSFQMLDANRKPLNSTKNGGDSVLWAIPSLSQLGLTEKVAPKYVVNLRWAPGFAFELGGTYMPYNTAAKTTSGNAINNSNKLYNLYFAHDILYWLQRYHYEGWHVTGSAELTNINQSINLSEQAKFFQNYSVKGMNVSFDQQIKSIDLYSRTVRYGLNIGKSWPVFEVWGGFSRLTTKGGISDNGYVSIYIDEDPNNPNDGVRIRRMREFFFSGISETKLWNMQIGWSAGQKSIRFGAQYNIMSNGMHQGSAVIKYVFKDNFKHPWQMPDYVMSIKPRIVRKTVYMDRSE